MLVKPKSLIADADRLIKQTVTAVSATTWKVYKNDDFPTYWNDFLVTHEVNDSLRIQGIYFIGLIALCTPSRPSKHPQNLADA